MQKRDFDLEERLLAYAAQIIRLVDEMPATRAGNHIASQLVVAIRNVVLAEPW